MQPAIRVDNISKHYRIGARQKGYRTLRESLAGAFSGPARRIHGAARRAFSPDFQGDTGDGRNGETLWALKDVSFDVQPGEVVGIIGRNGAGKSTLLKILSRITEPTSGRITLKGRVGSLLEVGTGFHPELTGRENIYMNGAILGMTRREIDRKFDEIVDFSGVEKFLDTPVKRYSSGMQVRLAFSVAAHLEPEILVIDEVLAVGDSAFQNKCMGRMQEVRQSGATVLFVSHNMGAVATLCESAVYLDAGTMITRGACADVVAAHARSMANATAVDFSDRLTIRGGTLPTFVSASLVDHAGLPTTHVMSGEPLSIRIGLHSSLNHSPLNVRVSCDDALGAELFRVGTHLSTCGPIEIDGLANLLCRTDPVPLPPGHYTLTLRCSSATKKRLDVLRNAVKFEVLASDYYGTGKFAGTECGKFLMRSQWKAVPSPNCSQ